uniref:Uncharacterized protein n=1 Tax=Arion vulgaris TaxID=1028688 RepID=A0A0B6Z8T3_9EUPU
MNKNIFNLERRKEKGNLWMNYLEDVRNLPLLGNEKSDYLTRNLWREDFLTKCGMEDFANQIYHKESAYTEKQTDWLAMIEKIDSPDALKIIFRIGQMELILRHGDNFKLYVPGPRGLVTTVENEGWRQIYKDGTLDNFENFDKTRVKIPNHLIPQGLLRGYYVRNVPSARTEVLNAETTLRLAMASSYSEPKIGTCILTLYSDRNEGENLKEMSERIITRSVSNDLLAKVYSIWNVEIREKKMLEDQQYENGSSQITGIPYDN